MPETSTDHVSSEVSITPSTDYPVPYDTSDEEPATFIDALQIAANTAEAQVVMGAVPELSVKDEEREKRLLQEVLQRKDTKGITINTAYAAAAFLKTYGQQLAMDIATTRAAITNKLMELANCGDPKFELRALELLGKHSDIGLFTERSEITINYKDPADLEEAIKERVKRLLNADIIDVTPMRSINLDDELGVVTPYDDDEEQPAQKPHAEAWAVPVPDSGEESEPGDV